jgi:hypothetical protein
MISFETVRESVNTTMNVSLNLKSLNPKSLNPKSLKPKA